jgi:hypothetical protein
LISSGYFEKIRTFRRNYLLERDIEKKDIKMNILKKYSVKVDNFANFEALELRKELIYKNSRNLKFLVEN